MPKILGFALVLVFFAADVASAQTLRYTNRSNPGASQLSNHQRLMGAQRREQSRKFGYQRNASHRQRMSQLNARNIQRTAGNRGSVTGTAAQVVSKKRELERNRQLTRRTDPLGRRTSQLDAAKQQRAKERSRAMQRPSGRKSRTLNW